jgi:5'-deoxynucleotidase YfbR-like HD superfamily hydrolase
MEDTNTQTPRASNERCPDCGRPSDEEIRKDVDAIFWSLRLHGVRRFLHQRFWEEESKEAECAERVEPWPKLESVSEHSWHVADTVLLLGSHFDRLDQPKCLEMAILHDKLEIITGDADPVGNGAGTNTHAFNPVKRAEKDSEAIEALRAYVARLRPPVAQRQQCLLEEIIQGRSQEAHFVRGVDKLQAFAFVIAKKRGEFQDRHLVFTLRYVEKGISGFPGLRRHFEEMRCRLVKQVADRRQKNVDTIEAILGLDQSQPPANADDRHPWSHNETSP